MGAGARQKLGWGRITIFASGDFAFSLYWQSISLYLLFYYTDALGLPAATAGLIYMLASVWDGIVDPIIGAAADRTRTRWGKYRPYLALGAIPLGLAFALLYYQPPLEGLALIIVVAAAHFLLRTIYALVNVPYAALTASITQSASERGAISGMRMMFATLAGLLVASSTQPIVTSTTGQANGAAGFFAAAAIFAVIATPIILLVFATTREEPHQAPPPHFDLSLLRGIFGNRAFWTLIIAASCVFAFHTAFAKSILYHFKYALNDEASARTALTLSSASGLVTLPLWMLASRWLSKRGVWLAAAVVYATGCAAFLSLAAHETWQMYVIVVWIQTGYAGMAYVFWAMLPDTVEYGEWRTGVRAEGMAFGVALLFQKMALGLGAAMLGVALDQLGYRPNETQAPETLDGLKLVMALLPLLGVGVGAVFMFFNPLRRGAHEKIVADLAQRATPPSAT